MHVLIFLLLLCARRLFHLCTKFLHIHKNLLYRHLGYKYISILNLHIHVDLVMIQIPLHLEIMPS